LSSVCFFISLAAVNFFLALTGITQCTRIFMWRSAHPEGVAGVVEEVKEEAKEVVAEVTKS
jgi:hypothetical protein